MPTYEYRCTECDSSLEAVQRFSDAPLTVCPRCQGRLRKVFSAVGVVFKGSGFYKTDSRAAARRDGQRVDAKSTDAAAAASNGSSAGSNGSADKGSSDNAKPDTSVATPSAGDSPKQDSVGSGPTPDAGASRPSPREPVHKVA